MKVNVILGRLVLSWISTAIFLTLFLLEFDNRTPDQEPPLYPPIIAQEAESIQPFVADWVRSLASTFVLRKAERKRAYYHFFVSYHCSTPIQNTLDELWSEFFYVILWSVDFKG